MKIVSQRIIIDRSFGPMQAEAVVRVFLLFLLSACSYHLKKNETVIKLPNSEPVKNPRIYIPIFDNITIYPGPELFYTAELRDTLSKIEGITIVHEEKDANIYLLGQIARYQKKRSATSVTGTRSSQAQGGLGNGELAADGVHLDLGVDLRLIYAHDDSGMKELLWKRSYSQESVFPASTRFEVSKASSSAPYINDARERIQLKILAKQWSRQVVDQVVQDF
ncbi:MAG: hypothetical protein KA116_01035 [Proteobacteria bacterium]|nr:hypothetical protein [Pseudomonadota bacterium]